MQHITVNDLKEMRDSNEPHFLLDVREPHEYEIANLGGELIPMGQLEASLDQIPKDQKVIVHCKSGGRSATAVEFLESKGYSDVYNLQGGILAWATFIDMTMPKY